MANVDPPDEIVSFAQDIVGLFRPMDIQCMRGYVPPSPDDIAPVLLADYDYFKEKPARAQTVLDYLKGDLTPRMPYGGPYWSDDALQLFEDWISGGLQP
jgi:hypothetical protein